MPLRCTPRRRPVWNLESPASSPADSLVSQLYLFSSPKVEGVTPSTLSKNLSFQEGRPLATPPHTRGWKGELGGPGGWGRAQPRLHHRRSEAIRLPFAQQLVVASERGVLGGPAPRRTAWGGSPVCLHTRPRVQRGLFFTLCRVLLARGWLPALTRPEHAATHWDARPRGPVQVSTTPHAQGIRWSQTLGKPRTASTSTHPRRQAPCRLRRKAPVTRHGRTPSPTIVGQRLPALPYEKTSGFHKKVTNSTNTATRSSPSTPSKEGARAPQHHAATYLSPTSQAPPSPQVWHRCPQVLWVPPVLSRSPPVAGHCLGTLEEN